jgi:hypothetical protein
MAYQLLIGLLLVLIVPTRAYTQALEVPHVPSMGLFDVRAMPDDDGPRAGEPDYGAVLDLEEAGVETMLLSEAFPDGLAYSPLTEMFPVVSGISLSIYSSGVISVSSNLPLVRLNPAQQGAYVHPNTPDEHLMPGAIPPEGSPLTGVALFKQANFDDLLGFADLPPDLIAPFWSEVADAQPECLNLEPAHTVHRWSTATDQAWREAHPGHWPMLVITWHQMMPRGACMVPQPNTFQLLLIEERDANGDPVWVNGRPRGRLQFRFAPTAQLWAAATPEIDTFARSGFVFGPAGGQEGQAFEFNLSGQLDIQYQLSMQSNLRPIEVPFDPNDPDSPVTRIVRAGTYEFTFDESGHLPADSDGDQVPNFADNCRNQANADQRNNDSDNAGDVCDHDDDGDRIPDQGSPGALDNCPLTANHDQLDADADGLGDACDADDDNDGTLDEDDNCPRTDNADQLDSDADQAGDACDPDDDNDGLLDEHDNCATVPNPEQRDTDGTGGGDLCDADDDDDGVPDGSDNCPTAPNPAQRDADGDQAGDACDDDDGDGVLDVIDNCPTLANPEQSDRDQDGMGDRCADLRATLSNQLTTTTKTGSHHLFRAERCDLLAYQRWWCQTKKWSIRMFTPK